MTRTRWTDPRILVVLSVAALPVAGCKVGPDYKRPAAPLNKEYRDTGSEQVAQQPANLAEWWKVFNDPVLDNLIQTACKQNPTLQTAAVRVLQAQAARKFAYGLQFPQQQNAVGSYTTNRQSENAFGHVAGSNTSFDDWQVGGQASWELDIWGKYSRGIESADAQVLASIASYDDVMVSLVGDVASEYMTVRTLQERLEVARANVLVQTRGLDIAETRFKGGTATDLDRSQATALLRSTEASIPEIEAAIVQSQNRLCLLMGMPPRDIANILGEQRQLPQTPASVAVGIPADLLRRRPDIRRVEHALEAQSALIGVAKSDLYPSFSLVGDLRLQSENFRNLFDSESTTGFVGPGFRWAILNYGRIENNVRVQDAQFQALVGVYEDTVLRAQTEVENALTGYLGAQKQVVLLAQSVTASQRAVEVSETQYRGGIADYTRVLNSQQALQSEQDLLVSTRGAVTLNLVSVYRAMGGGWEQRTGLLPLSDQTRKQMNQRTNWGDMVGPAGVPVGAPKVMPTTKPAAP